LSEQTEQETIRAAIFICAASLLNCTVSDRRRGVQLQEERLEIVQYHLMITKSGEALGVDSEYWQVAHALQMRGVSLDML
jgi:hypothetical protein